jgi:hypothetical protein
LQPYSCRMPSTVNQLFASAGLRPDGVVRWGTRVPEAGPGNYVVSLTEDPRSLARTRPNHPVAEGRLKALLAVRPELRVDGLRPSATELAARLGTFWLDDEVVLYVGLAGSSLQKRIGQYYRTPLGAKSPHAGGWWLKGLALLDQLWVHYAATPDSAEAELAMLQHFAGGVSPRSRDRLHDSVHVAPFANLRTGRESVKEHGITGPTGELSRPEKPARVSPYPAPAKATPPGEAPSRPRTLGLATASGSPAVSQKVTAKDLSAGRIRFPRSSKRLFPSEPARIDVVVRGSSFTAVRWDPGDGPHRGRSGMLSFGVGRLTGSASISVGDILSLTCDDSGNRFELR